MLRIIKYTYSLAELRYQDHSLPIIQTFLQPKERRTPYLFDFSKPTELTLMQRFFSSQKIHQPLIQLYIQLLKSGEIAPKGIAYQYIEQNLRKKIVSDLKKSKTNIIEAKASVLRSQILQHTEFMGVFIHRKFNLNLDSYTVNPKRPNFIIFELKSTPRSQALKLYEVIIRQYQKQKMHEVYGQSMIEFVKQKTINRYLYELTIDLKLTLQREDKQIKMGGEGPTKHLLQIESVFHPYSKVEEFYLTDVDCILSGNPFFREKITNF